MNYTKKSYHDIHESGEDYLEMILVMTKEGKLCRSVDLAAAFGYSRPAISRAVKVLSADGYLTVGSRGQLELTASGLKKAEDTLKRHKILTRYLKSIGVDEEIAEKDACRIEHIIHEETFQKIASLLTPEE